MLGNLKRLKMLSQQQLKDLRIEREEAIKNCEFDRVQAIDLTLQHLEEEHASKKKKAQTVQAKLEYDTQREQVKQKLGEIRSKYQNELFQKTVEFQDRLLAINSDYQEKNQKIAEQKAKDLELCTDRESPRVQELIKLAQQRARSKEYESAQQIYAEAEQLKQTISSKNQNDLESYYQKVENKNRRHFELQKKLIDEKKAVAFEEIKEAFDKEVLSIRRSLEKFAAKQKLPPIDESELFDNISLTDTEGYSLPPPKSSTRSSRLSNRTPLKTSSRPYKSPAINKSGTPRSHDITPSKSKRSVI